MIIFEVKNLTKKFGGLIAVNNVSFDVKDKEIVGLIGPNGAGKTTLFNVVTGFYKPEDGKVIFKGEDITNFKPHEVCERGIARTFQIVRPFQNMTVLENVMVGAFIRTDEVERAKEIAYESLEMVGLTHMAETLTANLNIPSRKLVELARCLATKPKMLMLDEVVSGLTPSEVDVILSLIQRIVKLGISIVMVEHVMRAVMSISNRVIVLNFGQKIAEGPPKLITQNAEVIKAYLGAKYAYARSS
jgi:branched-chain amino acid transport system ATP-binding protein